MSTSDYSILPLSKSDIPTLAKFVQDSKLGLTINRLLFKDWPNYDAQRENYTKGVSSRLDNPLIERFKVVDNESRLTIGHLVLTRKKPRTEAIVATGQTSDEKPQIPDYFNPEVFTAVIQTVSEIDTEKDVDHLELTHIYIKPSDRGKGIGSELVRLAIKKAADAGIPLSVTSEPQAHEFFQNLGFKDTKYADIELTKWAPKYTGFGTFRLFGMVISN